MARILFIPTNSRDSEIFIPIIEEIGKTDSDSTSFISLDYYNHQGSEKSLISNNIPFKKIEDYNSVNVKRILIDEKIDAVVVANDQSMIEKSFVISGNSLGLATIFIQNGAIPPQEVMKLREKAIKGIYVIKNFGDIWKRYTFFIVAMGNTNMSFFRSMGNIALDLFKNLWNIELRGHGNCKAIGVTSSYEKDSLANKGINPKKIVIVGNPKFDKMITRKYDVSSTRKNYGIPNENKMVLFITQSTVEHGFWTEGQRELFFKAIVSEISNMEGVNLVVKIHPMEDIGVYEKMLSDLGIDIPLLKDENIHELISASELMITSHSSTIIEAMILNKPVVIANLFGDIEFIEYALHGGTSKVFNKNEIRQTINNILNNEEVAKELKIKNQKFIEEHIQMADGKGAERASILIRRTIGKCAKK